MLDHMFISVLSVIDSSFYGCSSMIDDSYCACIDVLSDICDDKRNTHDDDHPCIV